MMIAKEVLEVINKLSFEGEFIEAKAHGDGYINDTYACYFKTKDKNVKRYILQRINQDVFKNPEQLMKNYRAVTDYLKVGIAKRGGDIYRETLTIIPGKDGKDYVRDSLGNYWRGLIFIEDTISYTVVNGVDDFYKTALAFGNFQYQLKDFPAETLYETIPNFHNTVSRYEDFETALKKDLSGRKTLAREQIDFAITHKPLASALIDMLNNHELPLKVTHNDTKLNNILMDANTKKGLCIIDLDTIMPGLVAYDYGDSIRAGACWSAEDEKDLDKVYVDLDLFEAYTKGFIEGSNGGLSENEIKTLPLGAQVISYELGLRFLTDFLDGDIYFKTSYPMHNLDRCKTQFKLVADMEEKKEELNAILKKYMKKNA
ncbi:MAG: aminoglycoside phosphotransferase family protein [Erysipelotrichaceae bacterium]